jgi:NADH:ubiquinone oxidoreductase subunit E
MEQLKDIEALRNLRALLVHDVYGPDKNVAKVCCGLPCNTLGSHKVAAALEDEALKSGVNIQIVKTGCLGLCQKGLSQGLS